ncbi:hypothetical protein VTI74DRAFT_1943 [Chaetomium olivicolor]
MGLVKFLPLLSLALSALSGVAFAGDSGQIRKRQAVSQGGVGTCHEQGWVPACPGAFPCVPPGTVCCDDDVSYAEAGESCPDDTFPTATASAGSNPGYGHPHSVGVASPAPTGPPHEHEHPDVPGPGIDFLGFGSNWYTFAMTFHFVSKYYSLLDDSSSILCSTEVAATTTVSVSATDEAQASQCLSSITATLPTEVFPTQTEAPVYVQPSVYVESPGSVESVWSHVHVPTATGSSIFKGTNETVGSATRVPNAVVTAGAQAVSVLGGVATAVAMLVLGFAVLL